MSEHTPGPWTIEQPEHLVNPWVVGPDSWPVCQINGIHQSAANARLIAAAPDLFAALDQIMHELGVPQPGYPQPVANAYDIARAALAKALGQNAPASEPAAGEAPQAAATAAHPGDETTTHEERTPCR